MISIAQPDVSDDAKDAVRDVLDSGMLADGPEVREFEAEFAAFCGTEHAVATSNGTTALHTALVTLGIGEGDSVLTTPFSFIATANVIRLVGAEPVFADIDPETYNLDPAVAREVAIEEEVDAIMPVHLYGLPADMEALGELATELDVPLIEDAAQAHGARFQGEMVGSFGDAACFSFYPTKNLTTGEGGMVVTDDDRVAERTAAFINHGRGGDGQYAHGSVGHNFRMTSMAAAIGRTQLERLARFTERRQENADRLTEGLADVDVQTPTVPDNRSHVFHQYTIRCEDRDGLADHLEKHDVGYGVYYPACIHEQPAYSDIEHEAPVAERATEDVLSLPVHPALSAGDVERIIEVITDYDD